MKRKNSICGQWSPRLIEMLESPAYRVLSLSAHRVISRIEIEHAHHGGNDNGSLPVTKQNFMDYGMDHDAIAPAIREAEALGFLRMKRGRGGNAEHHQPSRFFLTFAHGRDSRAYPPTHDWRKIKSVEEAEAIARAARENKDPRAVHFAQKRAAKKTKHRAGKPGPKPGRKIRTENATFPVRETRTTGKGGKPGPLSISRGGGRGVAAAASKNLDPVGGQGDLTAYVVGVVTAELDKLNRPQQDAHRRLQARLREHSLFDPVRYQRCAGRG
jgi:hypothetical protein